MREGEVNMLLAAGCNHTEQMMEVTGKMVFK